MSLQTVWRKISDKKQSQLCVGLDPAEIGQRDKADLRSGQTKLDWALAMVRQVAPFASAIKPNRNYFKDFSRSEMQTLVREIHAHGLLAIDDCKITDIGDTVDAGLYHSAVEGFDAVTFAPFAGNMIEAAESAAKHNISLIALVLMSNPEFQKIKNARFGEESGFECFAREASQHPAIGGVVIGAPSPQNHITTAEIETVRRHIGERVVLMPGIGHQGGELAGMLKIFEKNLIVNVGRAIFQAQNPTQAAEKFCLEIRQKA